MRTLTQNEKIEALALTMKENGLESPAGQQAWAELLPIIPKIALGKIKDYARYFNITIDTDEVISRVGYEGVMQQLKRWEPARGSFKSLLLSNVDTQLKDARKSAEAHKHKALNHSVSLETPINDTHTLQDVIADDTDIYRDLDIESDPTYKIIHEYSAYTSKAWALVVYAIIFAESKKEQAELICKALNIAEYNASARVKVARIKKDFKQYCIDCGIGC